MPTAVLIDYGCHSFTYRLATHLSDSGYPFRYYANGSLESPNLTSLNTWVSERPHLVRRITCRRHYGKMSLHRRLKGEIEWAGQCIRALEEEQPSVVIVSCVPLVAVTRIQAWARRRGLPFIYWLQDLQGRAIHDLLGRKLGFPGRVGGALAYIWEQQVIEQSRMVITIANGHEKELPRSITTGERYSLLENWANIEEFPLFPHNNDWAAQHGLAETLNVLYSGTLGLKHDLGTFLALASAFRDRPQVRIVIVSSDQAAEILRSSAISKGLTNLIVLPFQPYKDVPKVLASGSVLIAPLDNSAGSFCVPSKVLSYLCAGRPTVIAIDSQNPAAAIIEQIGAGSVVSPGDPQAFIRAVERFLNEKQRREQAGYFARSYAERTFALENVIKKFLHILTKSGVSLTPANPPSPQLEMAHSATVGS